MKHNLLYITFIIFVSPVLGDQIDKTILYSIEKSFLIISQNDITVHNPRRDETSAIYSKEELSCALRDWSNKLHKEDNIYYAVMVNDVKIGFVCYNTRNKLLINTDDSHANEARIIDIKCDKAGLPLEIAISMPPYEFGFEILGDKIFFLGCYHPKL